MKTTRLTRVIAILLVLLLAVPSSALAITYRELADIVYNTTTDSVISVNNDLVYFGAEADWAPLYNLHGVSITIDMDGNELTGMEIWGGIFTIINAVIYAGVGTETFAEGGYIHYGEYNDPGVWLRTVHGDVELTLGQGVVLDIPTDPLKWRVEDGSGNVIDSGQEPGAPPIWLNAWDGRTITLRDQTGQDYLLNLTVGADDLGPYAYNEAILAWAALGYTIEQYTDENGILHMKLVPPPAEAPPPKPVRQELNRLVSSPFHLFQLYLSSMSYDARLYGDGEKVTFKQWLINMGGGNTMVRLRTSGEYDELALSITVGALKRLVYSARVTVLRVVNGRSPDAPYADYDTALLLALALAAGLADDVELYLAGPDADIMIRNADGTLTKL